MIRVTIEMVPSGTGKPRPMHVIEIWNTVARTVVSKGRLGDYGYRVSRKITRPDGTPTWHRQGVIERFPRSQKNAVHLLLAVLRHAYEEESKP